MVFHMQKMIERDEILGLKSWFFHMAMDNDKNGFLGLHLNKRLFASINNLLNPIQYLCTASPRQKLDGF